MGLFLFQIEGESQSDIYSWVWSKFIINFNLIGGKSIAILSSVNGEFINIDDMFLILVATNSFLPVVGLKKRMSKKTLCLRIEKVLI